jgi:predicted MPP superfamily phosphohydrolase
VLTILGQAAPVFIRSKIIIEQPAALLLLFFLSLLLGVWVFILGLNRAMNYLRDGAYKPLLLLLILIVTVGSLGILSQVVAARIWVGFLGAGYGLLGLGELHRLWIRHRSWGEAPVGRTGPPLTWCKPLTTTDLQTVYYRVRLPGWRGRPFRVVQLSDWHVNEQLPLDYFQSVIVQANQAQADLMLITGDFVTGLGSLPKLPGLLRELRSRNGIYAIFGNHDYWAGPQQVAEAVLAAGICLLGHGCQRVEIDPENALWLLGCELPWSRKKCEIPVLPPQATLLALSHSADYVYPLSRGGVKAVFSGHFHGGQFHIPGLGPVVVPSRYGRRFTQGHFRIGGAHLFVSAGIGCDEPALRLYCPPEILVVDFKPDGTDPDSPG